MDNLCLYQTFTDKMSEDCGLSAEKYKFSYTDNIAGSELKQRGTTNVKLTDNDGICDVEAKGLTFTKTVRIEKPDVLKGPSGIACRGAEVGLCIIWSDEATNLAGCILPESEEISDTEGQTCIFKHSFQPGTVTGSMELKLAIYIKKCAKEVLDDEYGLINEAGVTVGELENISVNLKDTYMEFPIKECCSENEPLWWVEFSDWDEDNLRTDCMFSRDSFCLYLNTFYEACPTPVLGKTQNTIKNFDMLVDILAQTYLLMFQRLDEADLLQDTKNDTGLERNTVCSVLHQFIESCIYEKLHWESWESLLKSLQINIRKMLQED